uniref:Uncharacterized protein n=1 Tax=Chelydra serpentina TaxID=8475 RepID=A0A8C3S4R0_CHESE
RQNAAEIPGGRRSCRRSAGVLGGISVAASPAAGGPEMPPPESCPSMPGEGLGRAECSGQPGLQLWGSQCKREQLLEQRIPETSRWTRAIPAGLHRLRETAQHLSWSQTLFGRADSLCGEIGRQVGEERDVPESH